MREGQSSGRESTVRRKDKGQVTVGCSGWPKGSSRNCELSERIHSIFGQVLPYLALSLSLSLSRSPRGHEEKDFIISIEPARKKRQANFALDLLHRTAQVVLAYTSATASCVWLHGNEQSKVVLVVSPFTCSMSNEWRRLKCYPAPP